MRYALVPEPNTPSGARRAQGIDLECERENYTPGGSAEAAVLPTTQGRARGFQSPRALPFGRVGRTARPPGHQARPGQASLQGGRAGRLALCGLRHPRKIVPTSMGISHHSRGSLRMWLHHHRLHTALSVAARPPAKTKTASQSSQQPAASSQQPAANSSSQQQQPAVAASSAASSAAMHEKAGMTTRTREKRPRGAAAAARATSSVRSAQNTRSAGGERQHSRRRRGARGRQPAQHGQGGRAHSDICLSCGPHEFRRTGITVKGMLSSLCGCRTAEGRAGERWVQRGGHTLDFWRSVALLASLLAVLRIRMWPPHVTSRWLGTCV